MKSMVTAFAALTLTVSITACDQAETETISTVDGLAGEWRVNLDSAEWDGMVDEYLIADGSYSCLSCDPPLKYTANGEWQDVERPGLDGVMMKIVDDKTVKVAGRYEGEDTGNSIWTVSDDGKTMKISWTNLRGTEAVSGVSTLSRIETGPKGAHAASGKWTPKSISGMNDAGLLFSFEVIGDTVTNAGNGTGYTATLGGEAVPIEGSDSGAMVAIERTGKSSYRETFSREGKVISTTELTIDGNTLSGVSTDARDGSVVRWTATRQ